MISDSARAALDALAGMGWTIRPANDRRPLPAHIDARYPAIPPPVRSFLEHLDKCVRSGEQVWFLTLPDYSVEAGSTIAWNEWEKLESEENQDTEISAFWDRHFPILHSVASDYAYLAVCVDPASAAYGNIVRGDAPEFRETVTVCGSFDELLEQIAQMRRGPAPDNLADLFLDPYDDRNLRGAPQGFFDKIADRFRSLPLFERYRISVVVEPVVSRPLWNWENWSKIIPPLTAVIKGLGAEAVIRPRQAGDHDNWLRFGRLPWNENSNRTWTTKYLTDPKLAGKVQFFATEIWAPSRAISFESRRGPELFCMLDRNAPAGSQGVVLAVRKDVLGRVDIAADATEFAVRELLPNSSCATFERRWGEHGRFGSTLVDNGLDWTTSDAVLSWAKSHTGARVASFRWRRSMRR